MWLPDLDRSGPKYLSISSALARDIEEGRLAAGHRLPSQRELADALGVDLGTVTRAYGEARRLGLIDADGRRGSFVRSQPGATIPADIAPFDTGMNLPPIPVNSSLARRYRASLDRVLQSPLAANRLQYQPSGGAPVDRAAGAAWLSRRGIEASEDTVLAVSGAQTGLHAIASATLGEGDVVCTGPFVYPGWLAVARRMKLEIVALPSDGEGLDPAALERACASRPVQAVYVVPTNDNPTTATMGEARRREIAAVARRHDLRIIEDDAYGYLPSSPLPPLAALAPERTWHVASLSKIISPALRVAYLRAPSLREAWRVMADVHETTVMAPPLNVAVATEWLGDGSWAELVGEVRAECVARQAMVRDILGDDTYRADPEGYHLWVEPGPGRLSSELTGALAAAGLSVVSSDAFAVDPEERRRAMRISIGGALGRDRLERALQLVATLLDPARDRPIPLV